jgi:hypothetical protein
MDGFPRRLTGQQASKDSSPNLASVSSGHMWHIMTLRKCQFCLTGFPDFGFTKVSLRAIFEQSNDVEFLKEIVPKLVK